MRPLIALFSAIVLASAAASGAAAAPAPSAGARDTSAQIEALKKLAFLHGRWGGVATMRMPDGSTKTWRTEDVVRRQLGGTLMTIHGRNYAGLVTTPQPVSENLGLFVYDERSGQYEIRAYAGGEVVNGRIVSIEGTKVVWILDTPNGLVRFDVFADGPTQWVEQVERSTDAGRTWARVMEIRFTRKPGE